MEEWNTEHERKEDEVEEDPSKDDKFDDEVNLFIPSRLIGSKPKSLVNFYRNPRTVTIKAWHVFGILMRGLS